MYASVNRLSRFLLAAAPLALAAGLNGCATGNFAIKEAANSTGQIRLSGSVFGGQQPVSGSTIQLYTVGTASTGSQSTALIAATVLSGAQGQFAITGDYSCSSATQVYLTATGGNAGSGANSAIAMMASLGSCSTLLANASTTFINLNELTTVAAVYSLSPYMTDYTHIGATGANATGLVNAFTTSAALVSTATGQIAATPQGITLPVTRLNTLADILAACINTGGPTSSQCSTLFTATGATETIGAALAIARNPGAPAITALWTLPSASSPFVPTVTAQPNDFTVAIKYAGTELLSPYGIAVDASGNAWVSNEAGSSVVRLPRPGIGFTTATFTGNGTLLAPRGVSIDRTGNVWVANTGGNNIVELSSAGAILSGTGYTGGGLATPVALANDSVGNVWVANQAGNTITELGPSGAVAGTSPFGAGTLALPTSIALDGTGRVLVSNAGSGALCIFTTAGALQNCANDGSLFGATAVAVNGSSVAMAGSLTGQAVIGAFTLATTGGTVNASSPVSGGGLALPSAVTYDGNGRAWFANTASISDFASASPLSPTTGFNGLSNPAGIAVDPSGNVWTANSGDNSVSIFVGLAAPTVTPLAANVGP